MEIYQKYFWRRSTQIRVPTTKWVVLRYPSPSMSQLANTSTEGFEDFYFRVCNLDYARMSGAMDPLVALMNRTRPRAHRRNRHRSLFLDQGIAGRSSATAY